MKLLLIFIHSILLVVLSIAVGLSLYGMLGPPHAKTALTDDFGQLAFFLTQPLGLAILYVVFVLFLTYIIWLLQHLPIANVTTKHYHDMVKRTEMLEKRQEAAFQQLTQLEAGWTRMRQLEEDAIKTAAPPEDHQHLIRIKEELDEVLEKIQHQKKYPYSELLDYIQTQIEGVETQISDWVRRPNPDVFEEPGIPVSTPAPEEAAPLPSRRNRQKAFHQKRISSLDESARQLAQSGSLEAMPTPPVDRAPSDLSELPSRRMAHAPWWRKRRTRAPEKEKKQPSDPLT